jgi:hypothetical protein
MLQPSPTNPIVTQATSHSQHSGMETASDLLARPFLKRRPFMEQSR